MKKRPFRIAFCNAIPWFKSIPAQGPASLVLDHTSLEEILLLFEIHHLTHPGERIFSTWERLLQTDLGETSVCNELEVLLHHLCIHAQHAAWHGVFRVVDFEQGALNDHSASLFLKFRAPELGIFEFDLVDHVDPEVQVHRFISKDVLELLGNTHHLVATTHGQDLSESTVEEDAFGDHIEANEVLQEALIRLARACVERRVTDMVSMGNAPGGFASNRLHLMLHIEDLTLLKPKGLNAILIRMRMDGLFKGLSQNVLTALRVGDQSVDRQHQIIGHE